MLCDNDEIITDSISVANIFNKYFMEIAESIGFNDPIPSDFQWAHSESNDRQIWWSPQHQGDQKSFAQWNDIQL